MQQFNNLFKIRIEIYKNLHLKIEISTILEDAGGYLHRSYLGTITYIQFVNIGELSNCVIKLKFEKIVINKSCEGSNPLEKYMWNIVGVLNSKITSFLYVYRLGPIITDSKTYQKRRSSHV